MSERFINNNQPVSPADAAAKKSAAKSRIEKRRNNDRGGGKGNAWTYVLLSMLSFIWVLPIVYLVYTAFRVSPETGIVNKLIPDGLTLGIGNFRRLFTETSFPVWLKNTLIVSSFSCLITSAFVVSVAYALSRMRFKMRKPLMNVLLVLGMFPGFMSMVAIYFILKAMGLTDSLTALVLVYSGGGALSYYICKGFFDTVPRAMEEAAFLDGATQASIFFKITLPLSKPVIVYTVLTSFIAPWCDFIFVNTIVNDREKFTVALGLYKLINEEKSSFNENFTLFCAGACVVGAIIVALFTSMQRYYVEGITSGSVKG